VARDRAASARALRHGPAARLADARDHERHLLCHGTQGPASYTRQTGFRWPKPRHKYATKQNCFPYAAQGQSAQRTLAKRHLTVGVERKQLLRMRYAAQGVASDRNQAAFDVANAGECRRHQDRLINRTASGVPPRRSMGRMLAQKRRRRRDRTSPCSKVLAVLTVPTLHAF
jgi:hypothetical protein